MDHVTGGGDDSQSVAITAFGMSQKTAPSLNPQDLLTSLAHS